MDKFIEYLITAILSGCISLVIIPVLTLIATKIQLVDKPNSRKIHTSQVPLIGGISIVISTFVTLFVDKSFKDIILENSVILGCASVVLIMGILDDKFDLNAKLKLLIQFVCAAYVAYSGIRVTSLYGFWGIHTLPIGLQYLLTIILITGVVNSFNLMDGVDGLAGGLAVLGFFLFSLLNHINANYNQAVICVALAASSLVFLKYNFSTKKIFMGDAGSLTLGFVLATMGIQMIERVQIENHPSQQFVLLIVIAFFAIPTLDSLRVYKGRIKNGNSPFKADKSHLHHLFLSVGVNHRNIALSILLLVTAYLIIILEFNHFLSLTLLVSFLVSSFSIFARGLNLLKSFNSWKEKIAEMESEI